MRWAGALLLVLAGALTGLSFVALHETWWGFLLGAAATAAALVVVRPGWLIRVPFAVGWIGLVGWVMPQRPEGDYVIAGDFAGYALLGFGLLVLVFAVATLPRPERVSGERGDAS